MNSSDSFCRSVHWKAVIAAAAFVHLFTSPCLATEMEVTLESGSVFLTDIPLSNIEWKEVQSNGQMTARRIALEDIRRLSLCETPASNKVAEIRELLVLLQSNDYHKREHAEAQLSNPDVGGLFPKMLRQTAAAGDAETRYRADRILNKISDAEASAPSEYDELELKSGRTLRGDAGDFRFKCMVDGQNLSLRRNQLRMLRKRRPDPESKTGSSLIETEIVLVSAGKFYQPEQTTIHLETDPFGNELERKADISRTYIPYGLKLASKEPGYVGISGYGFKFPETPTGNNSGSIFTEFRSGNQVRYKKYIGTLIVTFCLPNQPSVHAGVNEFGIHIANVDHERDFIMEAFNATGQIVGTVEVGERDCPFLGIKSNELIAELRIRRNPYLKKLKRKVDDDYAFDSLCFSKPKAIESSEVFRRNTENKEARIRLNNGDLWIGDRIAVERDGSINLTGNDFDSPVAFKPETIEKYSFGDRNIQQRPSRRSWSMQLTDGSILKVDPSDNFRSHLVPEYQVSVEQAVGLWPTKSHARFAHSDDWKDAKNVIVLPTGRVLTNRVNFTDDGYSWKTLDRRLQDLAPNANDLAKDEDPMPELTQVIYRTINPVFGPTLWLQQPRTLNRNAGYVQLLDGQRLMLGQGNLFQLVQRGKESIELKLNNRSVEIENDRILAVKFETQR